MAIATDTGFLLPAGFDECERGNTCLSAEDGAQILWVELEPGRYLEVAFTPGNYPAWGVKLLESNPDRLWAHVHANLGGWFPGKWNLPRPPRLYADGSVISDVGIQEEPDAED